MCLTLKIEKELLQKSGRIADEFLNENPHLSGVSAYYQYNQRLAGFSDIVDSAKGYSSFTPVIKLNVSDTWARVVHDNEYDSYFHKVDSLQGFDYHNERQAWGWLFRHVRDLSHDNIIARSVPPYMLTMIKDYKAVFESFKKCPVSPKLTKLVGFMFGEKSGGAMDWLTTKAPREDKAGELDEYRIFVSVLPHHVAGMSYYSSGNHGGDNWQGYSGTSCQDPKRSYSHDLINHLPASIMEQTLGVAWLAKRENNDAWSPIYEARTNIRIVPCTEKNVFIMNKPYYSSPTAKHILIEGLKAHFPNMMIEGDNVNRWDSDCTDVEVNISNCEYEGRDIGTCDHCGGDGEIEKECYYCDGTGLDRYECADCDGTGYDNDNCEESCTTCDGEGYTETECYGCDGHGHKMVDCSVCDGAGDVDEYSGDYLPYVDDTGIIDLSYDTITYTLPTDLLLDMGAIVEDLEELEA